MAKSSDNVNTVQVFDYQVKACKTFFKDELPGGEFKLIAKEDRPDNMKRFAGPVYDITGFDARQVVAVLSDIVNDKCPYYPWENNKTFYLWIRNKNNPEDDFEELFRLKAGRPTKDQPGNGIVFLRPKGKTYFKQQPKKYDELNGALEGCYQDNDTASFAKHIKQLFLKNNEKIDDIPEETIEAYMILLFEIARRLVTTQKPGEKKGKQKKEEFDVLPIGSVIASFVKLLEPGTCRFKDVFLPGGRFHCFTGKPEVRMKAIDDINMAILADITKDKTARKANNLQLTEEYHLAVLQALFSSGKLEGGGGARGRGRGRRVRVGGGQEELATASKSSVKRTIDRHDQKPSWSEVENFTAFDYFEYGLHETRSAHDPTFVRLTVFGGCVTLMIVLWRLFK